MNKAYALLLPLALASISCDGDLKKGNYPGKLHIDGNDVPAEYSVSYPYKSDKRCVLNLNGKGEVKIVDYNCNDTVNHVTFYPNKNSFGQGYPRSWISYAGKIEFYESLLKQARSKFVKPENNRQKKEFQKSIDNRLKEIIEKEAKKKEGEK